MINSNSQIYSYEYMNMRNLYEYVNMSELVFHILCFIFNSIFSSLGIDVLVCFWLVSCMDLFLVAAYKFQLCWVGSHGGGPPLLQDVAQALGALFLSSCGTCLSAAPWLCLRLSSCAHRLCCSHHVGSSGSGIGIPRSPALVTGFLYLFKVTGSLLNDLQKCV